MLAELETVLAEFQSAPGGEAGGNHRLAGGRRQLLGFNPPPAVRPGETRYLTTLSLISRCFNPPPAVRPGETDLNRLASYGLLFQSAPGGEAGGNARGA